MKRFYFLYIWAIIAFSLYGTSLKAQNPTLDAQWTVKTNNGSQLVLELGIRTNTAHEHLGPAQFIFLYDHTDIVKFNGGSTGPGTEGIDYNWIDSLSPAIYTGSSGYAATSSVSQPTPGTIIVNLDFSGAPGAAISSTTDYTPVVDINFSVSDQNQSTNITWQMSEGDPPTLDNVADDGYASFDTGSFKGFVVNPLPVKLIDFTAQLKNHTTNLSWTTASEINNDYFTVERSADGLNFSPVMQVPGAGNSQERRTYSVSDNSPLHGTSYYRLRQTDFNNDSEIFNIVAINNSDALPEILKITNASINSGKASISYLSPENGTLAITILDMNGKLIHKEQVAGQKGINIYSFSDAAISKPGIYSIVIHSQDQYASTKIINP